MRALFPRSLADRRGDVGNSRPILPIATHFAIRQFPSARVREMIWAPVVGTRGLHGMFILILWRHFTRDICRVGFGTLDSQDYVSNKTEKLSKKS